MKSYRYIVAKVVNGVAEHHMGSFSNRKNAIMTLKEHKLQDPAHKYVIIQVTYEIIDGIYR